MKSYAHAQVAFAQIDFSVITYCSVLLFNVHLSNDLFSGHFQLHCCDWLIVTDDRLSCIILVCRSQRKLTKQDSTLQYLQWWSLWMLHTRWTQTSQKKEKERLTKGQKKNSQNLASNMRRYIWIDQVQVEIYALHHLLPLDLFFYLYQCWKLLVKIGSIGSCHVQSVMHLYREGA